MTDGTATRMRTESAIKNSVEVLLARMTLAERIGQMTQVDKRAV